MYSGKMTLVLSFCSVAALDLHGAKHADSYDFCPGQIVGRADDDLSDDKNGVSNPLKRKGIFWSMESRQRTAVFKWKETQGHGFNETEEEQSFYELTSDESNLSIGDVMMRAAQGKTDDPDDECVSVITGRGVGKCTLYWHGGPVSDTPQSQLTFLKTEDDEDSNNSEEREDSEEASNDDDHRNRVPKTRKGFENEEDDQLLYSPQFQHPNFLSLLRSVVLISSLSRRSTHMTVTVQMVRFRVPNPPLQQHNSLRLPAQHLLLTMMRYRIHHENQSLSIVIQAQNNSSNMRIN